MRRSVILACAAVAAGMICLLQVPARRTVPLSGSDAIERQHALAAGAQPGLPATTGSSGLSRTVASVPIVPPTPRSQEPPAPALAPASSVPRSSFPADKVASEPSTPRTALPDASAGQDTAEATIVEIEEDGVITFRADPSGLDENDWAVTLQDIVQSGRGSASWELLQLFNSTADESAKAQIVSASSLLEPDQATRIILQDALAAGQPADLRLAALDHAAEREPDLILAHVNDPDLAVEIASIMDDPQQPDESRVIGAGMRPARSANIARAPATANQSQ
jgi:hypothetical protein